ncbi:MAG: translocation/assembly module TamB domain-containing protein, partial [Armatimonadota bacterium]
PAVNNFNKFNLSLDGASFPEYVFNADFKSMNKRFDKISILGKYDIEKHNLYLDTNAIKLNAGYWFDYALSDNVVKISNGYVDASVGLGFSNLNKDMKFSIRGNARVINADVNLPWFNEPLKSFNADLKIDKNILDIKSSLFSIGSQINLIGIVKNINNDPYLDLKLSSPALDYTQLTNTLNLKGSLARLKANGKGKALVSVIGPWNDYVLSFYAQSPEVLYMGYSADNVSVTGQYSKGLLIFQRAAGNIYGGLVNGTAKIELKKPAELYISAKARQINLNKVAYKLPANITGIASADFTIKGKTSNPKILGSSVLNKGSVSGISFSKASADIQYQKNTLNISNGKVAGLSGGGSALFQGNIINQNLMNIDLLLNNIDIKALRIQGNNDFAGKVFFAGNVKGNLQNPILSGTLEGFDLQYKDFVADYTKLDMSARKRLVSINDGLIRIFPAKIAFKANIADPLTPTPRFAGSADVENLSVSQWSDLESKGINVKGIVNGHIDFETVYLANAKDLNYPFKDSKVYANFRMANGFGFGYPIDWARFEFRIKDEIMNVLDISANSGDAFSILKGTIDLEKEHLDMSYEARGFQLERLSDLQTISGGNIGGKISNAVKLSGVSNMYGTISGYIQSPVVNANADIIGLRVNGYVFDRAQTQLHWEDNLIQTADFHLYRAEHGISVNIYDYDVFNMQAGEISGTIQSARLSELWGMFRASPYFTSPEGRELGKKIAKAPALTSGTVNGDFVFGGNLKKPDGWLNLNINKMGIERQRFDDVNIELFAENGIVELKQLTAGSDELVITAHGKPLYQDGIINLDFSAMNLNLEKLRPWLGDNTPGGIMSADFEIYGDIKSPHIIGSLEIDNPSFKDSKFDKFRASRIEVTENNIELSYLILSIGGHQATAMGTIPWDWKTFSIPNNEEIQISGGLREQDIKLLASLFPLVDESKTHGTINAEIKVGGTISNPQLDGVLKIEDGTFAMIGMTNVFENINSDIILKGSDIIINKLSTDSSLGGSLEVVPGSTINLAGNAENQYDIKVQSKGLVVGERQMFGFDEIILTQIDAGLSITGKLLSPMIKDSDVGDTPAGVLLSNTTALIGLQEGEPKPLPEFLINPMFDITIRLGNNVRLGPPRITLFAGGSGRLTGSLAAPRLNGIIDIQRGNLDLATARLKMLPGGKIYVDYTREDPRIRLELTASANVLATNPFGDRERYEIFMRVGGNLGNLQIDLRSDPAGLSREQMLAALGHVEGIFTSGEVGLRRELSSVLTAVGSRAVWAPIEDVFVGQFGFEEFSLDYAPDRTTSLFISRELGKNFFLSYYQRLSAGQTIKDNTAWEIRLMYKLRGRYEISIGTDNQQDFSFKVGITKRF